MTTSELHGAPPWPLPKRFAFCFGFAFLVLANLPSPFYVLPGGARALRWLDTLWSVVVPAVGARLFHVHAPTSFNGSGDTTFHYVQLVVWGVVALVIAAVWSAVARSADHYEKAWRVLHVYVRYALAIALIKYGSAKIFKTQFPYPTLEMLVEPYGASSPNGLAWAFMGYSYPFNLIAGGVEMLSGLLLTMRRTTLFGALLGLAVMGNITALNFCFDVPVKIYSVLLLLMAGLVIYPHRHRLLDFLLRNRTAAPVEIRPLFRDRRLERARLVMRTLAVAAVALIALRTQQTWRKQYGDLSPRSPLRGVWNVDELQENGVLRPSLVTDGARWRRLIFDLPGFMSIYDMADQRLRYYVQLDEKNRIATLRSRDLESAPLLLSYTRPDPGTLVVDATVAGRKLHAVCHRMDERDFLLTSRGFHWVNDFPLQR
jgi:hypothetical protein